MLEKLIESTDNSKQKRRMRAFFATIGTAMTGLFAAGIIFSIFSTNLAMGSEAIDLSRLVAPAVLPDNAPPRPENTAPDKTVQKSKVTTLPKRFENMQRLEEVPVAVPNKISTTRNKYRARPNMPFIISPDGDSDGVPGPASNTRGRTGGPNQAGTGFNIPRPVIDSSAREPLTGSATTGPPPALVKKQRPVSRGVINGDAINLVVPVKSAAAISMNINGQVKVDVLINESGRVESANAVSGHALLRKDSVAAALRSTFKPTTLSDQPVKVRGVIIYNFK